MTLQPLQRAWAALLLAAALLAPATAHEGHDHGDATPAVALPALAPRAEASGDLFELLAVLEGTQLVLWVDRFASNEPVALARVEVEGSGWKAVAAAAADGSYRVAAPQPLGPGSHALVFTVQVGPDADLLEATLVVPAASAAPAAMVTSRVGAVDARSIGAGALVLVVLAALGLAALLWRRRHRARGNLQGAA